MSLLRPSREQSGPDPLLEWKIGLFLVGAVLGVAGMFTERTPLVIAAGVCLAAGVALRFFRRRSE